MIQATKTGTLPSPHKQQSSLKHALENRGGKKGNNKGSSPVSLL